MSDVIYAGYAARRRESVAHRLVTMTDMVAVCGVYIPIGWVRRRGAIPNRECAQCRAIQNRLQKTPNRSLPEA